MTKIDEFFKFEEDNRLFDILDEDGHRPWESVRFYVCWRVVNAFAPPHNLTSQRSSYVRRLFKHLYLIIYAIMYIIRHKHCPYMFMLSSREKKDGIYYDKICGKMYDLAVKSKSFSIDTIWHSDNYRYKGYTSPNELVPLMNLFIRKKIHFDFNEILSLLKSKYPDLCMSIKEMNSYYNDFKIQYKFYRFLFRYCNTKKVFIVQNGIQKGLFAAAKELGIEVIEFQHGQINKNHPAYSYPNTNTVTSDKLYHPSKLLTFGTFWHKDRCYPGVENIVIGNDSYAENVVANNSGLKKQILVISNMDDGNMLFSLVRSILNVDKDFYFYFKLHPNQYEEKQYFDELTRDYKNIQVLTNDYSINQLLAKTDAVLLVQSTVELEALKTGRKVFVIKEGAYRMMEFVFDERGVYLVDGVTDFIECYNNHKDEILPPRDDLFVPFKEEVARKLIQLNDVN